MPKYSYTLVHLSHIVVCILSHIWNNTALLHQIASHYVTRCRNNYHTELFRECQRPALRSPLKLHLLNISQHLYPVHCLFVFFFFRPPTESLTIPQLLFTEKFKPSSKIENNCKSRFVRSFFESRWSPSFWSRLGSSPSRPRKWCQIRIVDTGGRNSALIELARYRAGPPGLLDVLRVATP